MGCVVVYFVGSKGFCGGFNVYLVKSRVPRSVSNAFSGV